MGEGLKRARKAARSTRRKKRYAMVDPKTGKYAGSNGHVSWTTSKEDAENTAKMMRMVVVDADEFAADPQAVVDQLNNPPPRAEAAR